MHRHTDTHKLIKRNWLGGLAAAGILAGGALLGPAAHAQFSWFGGYKGETFRQMTLRIKIPSGSYAFMEQALAPGSDAVAAGLAPEETGLWEMEYDDPDGWMHTFGGSITLPQLRGVSIDAAFQTGDLEGDFEYSPVASDMVFRGEADIDREAWQFGLTVPLFAWIYGRVEYFTHDEESKLKYDDGDVERQAYDYQGLRFGLGATQDIPIGDSQFVLILNCFAGAVYFDYEAKERGLNLTVDYDGWGYILRGGAQVAYPVTEQLNIVGGASYEYTETNDDDLDFDEQALSLTLGVTGSF